MTRGRVNHRPYEEAVKRYALAEVVAGAVPSLDAENQFQGANDGLNSAHQELRHHIIPLVLEDSDMSWSELISGMRESFAEALRALDACGIDELQLRRAFSEIVSKLRNIYKKLLWGEEVPEEESGGWMDQCLPGFASMPATDEIRVVFVARVNEIIDRKFAELIGVASRRVVQMTKGEDILTSDMYRRGMQIFDA